jgi:phosphatidylglycerophosphatase A
MKKILFFIATGAYLGLSPVAPGTVGTLGGVLIAFLERGAALWLQAVVLVAVTIVSIYAAASAAATLNKKDPGAIVCDEISGYLMAFFLIPFSPFNAILVFILFRFFDILKPYPVSLIDRGLKGGAGIVLDDTAAGIYANISAQIILHFIS